MSVVKPNNSELIELYKAAVSLYQHEDELNWKKIQMLIYANSIMGAGLGLMDKASKDLIVILCYAGMALSLSFFITLFFGVLYLQNRKKKVMEFEKLFLSPDIPKIVHGHKRIYHISLTTLVLLFLPLLFSIFWFAVLEITK